MESGQSAHSDPDAHSDQGFGRSLSVSGDNLLPQLRGLFGRADDLLQRETRGNQPGDIRHASSAETGRDQGHVRGCGEPTRLGGESAACRPLFWTGSDGARRSLQRTADNPPRDTRERLEIDQRRLHPLCELRIVLLNGFPSCRTCEQAAVQRWCWWSERLFGFSLRGKFRLLANRR